MTNKDYVQIALNLKGIFSNTEETLKSRPNITLVYYKKLYVKKMTQRYLIHFLRAQFCSFARF